MEELELELSLPSTKVNFPFPSKAAVDEFLSIEPLKYPLPVTPFSEEEVSKTPERELVEILAWTLPA